MEGMGFWWIWVCPKSHLLFFDVPIELGWVELMGGMGFWRFWMCSKSHLLFLYVSIEFWLSWIDGTNGCLLNLDVPLKKKNQINSTMLPFTFSPYPINPVAYGTPVNIKFKTIYWMAAWRHSLYLPMAFVGGSCEVVNCSCYYETMIQWGSSFVFLFFLF